MIQFQSDTHESAFIYFQNRYAEITKDDIKFRPYSDLKNYVWKSNIIPIDFDFKENDEQSEFEIFLKYAINKTEHLDEDVNKLKYHSVVTSNGYLIHGFKDPSLVKAVVAVDKRISYTGDPNGRSGKSLNSKALSKLIKTVMIDGPNFKFDKDFNFARVQLDTRLINFNDVKPQFDFNALFSLITEDFVFSKKRMDEISIPFQKSPKFYISTNFTLRGDGDSSRGRQQVIEFGDYFNAEYTPIDMFKHRLFDDWDDVEWRRFYRYMIGCLQYFLKHGLIAFPLENYEVRKLTASPFGQDFYDYITEELKPQPNINYNKDELIQTFREKHPQWKDKPEKNSFTKWLNAFATMNEWVINPHKEGGRWKSNGIDYLVFVEKKNAKTFTEQKSSSPHAQQSLLTDKPDF